MYQISEIKETEKNVMTYFDAIKCRELITLHETLSCGYENGYCRNHMIHILSGLTNILNNSNYSVKEKVALGHSFYELLKHFINTCGPENFSIKSDFNGKIYCDLVGIIDCFELNYHAFTDLDGKVHITSTQGTKDVTSGVEPSVNILINERSDLISGKFSNLNINTKLDSFVYESGDPIHKSRDEDLTFVDFQMDYSPETGCERIMAKYVKEFDTKEGSSSNLVTLLTPSSCEFTLGKVKVSVLSKAIPKDIKYCFKYCIEECKTGNKIKEVKTISPVCNICFNPEKCKGNEFLVSATIVNKDTDSEICKKSCKAIEYLGKDCFDSNNGYHQIIAINDVRVNYFALYPSQFIHKITPENNDSKQYDDPQSEKHSGDNRSDDHQSSDNSSSSESNTHSGNNTEHSSQESDEKSSSGDKDSHEKSSSSDKDSHEKSSGTTSSYAD